MVKNPPAMQETWVPSLGQEAPLERKWQPTPVFLPGEFHEQRSLVGYSPWGCKELDLTEQLTHTVWPITLLLRACHLEGTQDFGCGWFASSKYNMGWGECLDNSRSMSKLKFIFIHVVAKYGFKGTVRWICKAPGRCLGESHSALALVIPQPVVS